MGDDNPNKKTSPLEMKALAAYEPTNAELMVELHRLNTITHGLSKHMGSLEKRLKPMEITYGKAMMIIGAASIIGPVLVSGLGYGIDIWLKVKGH